MSYIKYSIKFLETSLTLRGGNACAIPINIVLSDKDKETISLLITISFSFCVPSSEVKHILLILTSIS